MNKQNVLIIVLLLLSISAFASTTCTQNENCTLWATITSEGSFYTATAANITITLNGTDIYSNVGMTPQGIGIFKYVFVPSITGQYLAYVEFYNSTGKVAIESETVNVLSNNQGGISMAIAETGLAGVIAVGIIIAILLFLAFRVDEKHGLLQLLLLFSVLALMIFIPKIVLDSGENCGLVPVNSSSVNGITQYSYQEVCGGSPTTSQTSFYTVVVRIYYAILFYVGAYMIWKLFTFIGTWFREQH